MLSFFRIPKNQFQLLGATCLFLASKFKAIDHISSKTLRAYTDDSITEQELKVTRPRATNIINFILLERFLCM